MPSNPDVKIVVPDDFPPALTGSVAEAPLQKLGQERVFTERGADQEQTLIERIADAEVALNIPPRCASSPSGARAPTTLTWPPARPAASPSPTPPASTPTPWPSTPSLSCWP